VSAQSLYAAVMADLVTITFASDDGETREWAFTIDDYEARAASGDVAAYLSERVYPRLERDWKPLFHETGRTVEHGLCCVSPREHVLSCPSRRDEYVAAARAAGLDAETSG
jgi:hypothetical protein